LRDLDICMAIADSEVQFARDAGALEVLPVGVNVLAQTSVRAGDFNRANLLIAEANAVREATRTQVAPYGALVLTAFRGREDEATPLIETTIREAGGGGQGIAVQYAYWAKSVVMNGLGRYEEALEAATVASADTPELFMATWALGELIEAASRTGDAEAASDALARFEEETDGSESDWALGILARSRALLAGDDQAEALHREAVERLERTSLTPELARARLLYGEWLRRVNRRSEARDQLRSAYEAFLAMRLEA